MNWLLLLFACGKEVETTDYSSQIQDIEDRISQIETIHESNPDEDLSEEIEELKTENDLLQSNIDELTNTISVLTSTIDSLSEQINQQETRLQGLENSDTPLVISIYEVDCNSTFLEQTTNNYRCNLVEGVLANDIPLVQIFNNREAGSEYFAQWSCANSGSACNNSYQTFEYATPGMGLLYDIDAQLIYTSPHYRGNTDNEKTMYTMLGYQLNLLGFFS